MTFKRSDALAPIVVPAALWLREATVREHDPALDAPIAASVAQVLAHPPEETSDVRTIDRKSTRLNSSHSQQSRMPSSA